MTGRTPPPVLPVTPQGKLAYRMVLVVDDQGSGTAAATVRQHLGPAVVSLAVHTALLRQLVGQPQPRPIIGAVSVATHPTVVDDLDPAAPFTDPPPDPEQVRAELRLLLLEASSYGPDDDWPAADLAARLQTLADRLRGAP